MKLKIYSIILFLNSFLTGILTPVISLLLLDKGATLSNLSLILGIYAFTVIVLELPTGIIADVFGRKKSFCLSIIVSLVSFIILLFGKGFILLSIGMMFYGLSRALSSGSFDALFIDYYIDNYGKDKLHNITTRLNVLEALGMSTGALTGGMLPKITNTYFSLSSIYDLNIILRLILASVVVILGFIFITESADNNKENRITIKQHIINSSSIVVKNSTIICIFISVFSTGFFLSSLETFWQPHFLSLLPNDSFMGLLGVMAFLYFAAATLGSIGSNKLIKKYKFNTYKMYLILRTLIAVSMIITAIQTNIPIFMFSYSMIYLLFGMANIPEGVILNREIPNEVRASVLSVYSLVIQIGGLTGSLLYSILINYFTIPTIWVISASIILITIIVIYKKLIFEAAVKNTAI
ncbi:MFS transporter [Sedimentibacter hydroxybenzoicus DSM 7310]|uniref:MFS transporter n=1 Tax=Sedimentibacter hydroxybenzoicus DSM 7310 TaxID=1123245 RepID=A0A974BHX6_SEDHY|nr:MFS transporter [Sedimentibacter hydroxybenzoicus]NYB73504.1 MFS transporter [Sedimentibacter hydroxybenzoicus DSM 7310]